MPKSQFLETKTWNFLCLFLLKELGRSFYFVLCWFFSPLWHLKHAQSFLLNFQWTGWNSWSSAKFGSMQMRTLCPIVSPIYSVSVMAHFSKHHWWVGCSCIYRTVISCWYRLINPCMPQTQVPGSLWLVSAHFGSFLYPLLAAVRENFCLVEF